MPFSQEAGYTPASVQTILSELAIGVNAQFGTSYTAETFVGSNHYKYFYALAQRAQLNEIKASEIFLKLTQYITTVNERINRPSVTVPGLIAKFSAAGFVASVKPMIEADAGKIHVAVDVDDEEVTYDETKLEICNLLKDATVGGVVTIGTETETLVLTNGQAFDYSFNLPTRIPVLLKLTIRTSDSNMVLIGNPDDVKVQLLNNILSRYYLGRDFEPQRYFQVTDAPWASEVLLEWSLDDGTPSFSSSVYDAAYDEIFDFGLEDIELVEV